MRIGMGAINTAANAPANSCEWWDLKCQFTPAGSPLPAYAAPIDSPTVTGTAPGLPSGYNPTTGEIEGNADGSTVPTQYKVSYPNVPTSGGGTNDQFDPAGCDLTAQSWLSPQTWCQSRWTEVVLGGALVAVLLFAGLQGRNNRR